MRPLARLFISFHVPDYRMLWGHNVLASLGMSMEMLAQGWLVLVITDSPFWVGSVAGLRGIGQILLAPLGGVIADRFDRRRVLQLSQTLRATIPLAIGLLWALDRLELWHLLATALIGGLLFAAVLPANGTLIFDIVGRKRLLNAMAAQFAAFNIARLPGSILVGILISTTGLATAYFVIAGAFASSLIPLYFVKTRSTSSRGQQSVLGNLGAGFQYVAKHRTIRRVLAFTILIEAFGFGHQVMLPVIARDYLEVGPTGLGFLAAAGSVGGLFGITALGIAGDVRRKGILLLILSATIGVSVILFGLSPWYGLSLALAGVIQAGLVTYDSTLNTTLLLMVIDSMRGRILGLMSFAYGFTPVGGFIYGVIATSVGAPIALVVGGGLILTGWAGMMLPMGALRKPMEPVVTETTGER